MDRAKIEGCQHIPNKPKADSTKKRANGATTPTRQSNTAQHQSRYGRQCHILTLCWITRRNKRRVTNRTKTNINARNEVGPNPHHISFHTGRPRSAFVISSHLQVGIKGGCREQVPANCCQNEDQQYRRKDRRAKPPVLHERRRNPAWTLQNDKIDARQRKKA